MLRFEVTLRESDWRGSTTNFRRELNRAILTLVSDLATKHDVLVRNVREVEKKNV